MDEDTEIEKTEKTYQFSISRKTIKWFLTVTCITLPAVALTWFAFCDNIEARAQTSFDKRFDAHYPAAHMQCSNDVLDLKKLASKHSEDMKIVKSTLDYLALVSHRNISYDDKQYIAKWLVDHDSLTWGQAYQMIEIPKRFAANK